MFVFIAVLLSLFVCLVMLYLSSKRKSSYQQKYELITDLRSLVTLCRQHRSASHYLLYYGNPKSHAIFLLEKGMSTTTKTLISKAHFDNKPIYRILFSKITQLIDEWEYMTVSQNQMSHGRVIRHCVFLIDEVILAWLVESQRVDLVDEYNLSWHQINDSLESLTQLRVAIQDIDTDDGIAKLKPHAKLMVSRLNQLALIDPLAITSPVCSLLCRQLEDISESKELEFTQEQLYKMSTDASLIIFNTYDFLLSNIAESIYVPLPKLAVSI
ncbi:hypothetical protein L3V77_05185 [Vibrio sp. DW001]|uniref:hypothetical protein n=1 Tax=Vibrio sp. DW001 TaxID=2912315 RepID=UPI0023B005D4|nr:hypothetical protein [Vibrio sp. DW001]WED27630.1 hypothetical protein L3V77_05185 [Vibrio sp. DW001]